MLIEGSRLVERAARWLVSANPRVWKICAAVLKISSRFVCRVTMLASG